MRQILLQAAAAAVFTTAVSAADLPRRAAPPPIVPVPLFTWTGFYIGVNAGYAFDHTTRFQNANSVVPGTSATGVPGARPAVVSLNADGVTAGGQAGYNYQFTPGSGIVVGVEADAAYTDLRRTGGVILTNPANGIARLSAFQTELGFLGTVRGRIGYAFDRVLFYGTGGFAYGELTTATSFVQGTTLATPTNFVGGRRTIENGYAAGGGVEYALPTDSFLNFFKSNAVTLKVEGLYYDLGTRRTPIAAVPGSGAVGAYQQRASTNGVIVRAGLNYKFGTY